MPIFERDQARISYEVVGHGPPVLLIAPGGMRSAHERWHNVPWNPLTALADDFRLIAMDQRNAGASTAPISAGDGWDTYTADQLGLLDHLGIDRFAVIGMCIGGPFVMGLLRAAPERVTGAVMLQPIGLDGNRQAFYDLFDAWAGEVSDDHPEADQATFASFRSNMFDGDFLFNASREDVGACSTPLLVMMGDDLHHPRSTSREIAELASDVTFVERWKDAEVLEATHAVISRFLADHADPGA